MTDILSYSEIIKQKQATEAAIGNLLKELQEQTGCLIQGITTTKLIGKQESEIKVTIFLNQ